MSDEAKRPDVEAAEFEPPRPQAEESDPDQPVYYAVDYKVPRWPEVAPDQMEFSLRQLGIGNVGRLTSGTSKPFGKIVSMKLTPVELEKLRLGRVGAAQFKLPTQIIGDIQADQVEKLHAGMRPIRIETIEMRGEPGEEERNEEREEVSEARLAEIRAALKRSRRIGESAKRDLEALRRRG